MNEFTPPWWHEPFWILVFGAIFFIMAGTAALVRIFMPKKASADHEKERADSIELAHRIASCPQYVMRVHAYYSSSVALDLRENDEEMKEAHLVFFRHHPDFHRLRQLESWARISFEFTTTPIRKVNSYDAVAYLRLKE